MASLVLDRCEGIDTRKGWDLDDRFALEEGDNVQVLPGGAVASRPARIKVCDLSSSSVGLYARGGFLRALVPSGQSLQSTAPADVIYDGIGQGGSFNYTNKIGRIIGAETFGASQSSGPYGYVAFARADTGIVEHHWIKEPPAAFSSYVSTKVQLPFLAGRTLSKVAKHIVTTEPGSGLIRYSSVFDPTDWLSENDAGFEQALQHVSGAREITALGIHRGALAAFYADAVQLWFLDEIPENNYLKETLGGVGTSHPDSVVEVMGDSFFFGRSGFSTLATAQEAGQADFQDVGERIRTLTADIDSTDTVIGLWSQKRSQYLAAVGADIYCLSYYRNRGGIVQVWTKWTMPETVDYLVENAGVVYYRSSNVLYRLDDTQGRDSGASADFTWNVLTRASGFPKVKHFTKQLNELVAQNTARCTYTPVCDDRELTGARVILPGSVRPMRSHLGGSGRRVALRMAGSGLMRMDGVMLGAEVCGI